MRSDKKKKVLKARERISISVKDMKRRFTEKEIQMAYTHRRKHSISYTIKEMQIKTIMRHHFPLLDWQKEGKCQLVSASEKCKKAKWLSERPYK